VTKVTENKASAGAQAASSALLVWIDEEIEQARAQLPELERAARDAAEGLADADVIRRHVLLNPERFTPAERDSIVERAQTLSAAQNRAEVTAESVRDRIQFCEAVALAMRSALSAGEAAASGAPAPTPPVRTVAVFQAVEAERLQIAKDLQEGPAQAMADIVIKAEILDRTAKRTPDALPAELDEFKTMVRNAVESLRGYLFELRPDSLDELGLVPTMKRFSVEYQDRTGVACRFQVDGTERRPGPGLEEAIFRIVQEALANVARHSGAKAVEVILTFAPERIIVNIQDKGAGFDVEVTQHGGQRLGLLAMRERAESLGGRFAIMSLPGRGTEIEVEFPAP
jgi:two-component system sensor histidine kinase DegS